VAPAILAAIERANQGFALGYGNDALTEAVEGRFAEIFEHEVAVFLVPTGTAANALAIAHICPPWGGVLCHADSHIATDECGAPEFFGGGIKLIGLAGDAGKLTPAAVQAAIERYSGHMPHQVNAAALSLTQATEAGTAYRTSDVAALAETAHARGLAVHMDGARFANALSFVGCLPAELSWKAGVDVLSFGATKNGVLAAEAVIFFDANLAREFEFRRKRGGHLVSKMRLLSAQLDAYLTDGLWLDNARHANAMARRLVAGLTPLKGTQLLYPVDANEIFVVMPARMHDALQEAGAQYHPWPSDRPGERAFRLVTAFDTRPGDVDRFLSIAKAASAP